MDLGLVGIGSFVGLDSQQQQQQQEAKVDEAAAEAKTSNDNGSGSVKQQERSGPIEENHRAFKVGRLSSADDIGISSKTMHMHQGTPLLRSNPLASDTGGGGGRSQPQMLSFASPISEVSLSSKDDGGGGSGLGANRNNQNLNLSFYHPNVSNSTYTGTAGAAGAGGGYGSGNLNGSVQGSFTGIRGPFTPAQWIELEHQALIYKYLTAGVPVPASLLVPIRKALNSTGFSGFNAGSFLCHPYGWGGSFHLGFSGSSDPEPGRCRRTDGKKWRCSRDAVPDQKYCERHINRGRHRSRKPVENQTGQAAASGGPNTCATATNDNNRIVNAAAVPPSSVVSMPSTSSSGAGGACASIAAQHHQQQHMKRLQQPGPGINIPPADQIVDRFQDLRDLSMMPMPPSIDLKFKDPPFSIPKQHNMPYMESSDFGYVSTDSLLNPSLQKTSSSSYTNAKSFANSFLNFTEDQRTEDQHSIRQFMDDWPKDGQSNRSSMVWPEELKSDWTQLSMSIPVSDFSSSSSSPNQDKIGLSPIRLSTEVLDPTQMALGVGCNMYDNEPSPKSGNWMLPVSRGRNSMGGPLGEVLNNASNGSPQLGSSPTGVLQKATFVSLSNSSSGSSPRGENKKIQEGEGSLCDNLLGTAHASSSSIPAL